MAVRARLSRQKVIRSRAATSKRSAVRTAFTLVFLLLVSPAFAQNQPASASQSGHLLFSFSVDPSEQHLCANWQSMWKQLSGQHSFSSFAAEAGKTYFFRVKTQFQTYAPGPDASSTSVIWSIEPQPISPDEGKYLLSSSPLSISRQKKCANPSPNRSCWSRKGHSPRGGWIFRPLFN